MIFFLIAPPLFLAVGDWVLSLFPQSGNSQVTVDFHNNITGILIAYWGGTMGAVMSYIYDRLNRKLDDSINAFVGLG
jgi:hypothetical protein